MDNGKSVFEKLIKDDRAAHEQKLWRGTFLDYLERVREDPSLPKLAHSRLYDVIIKNGTSDILEGDDPRVKRLYKDEMVGSVAAHVVRRHEPDLLLLHFLCVDSLQHLHGPRSPEAYWALEYVDGLIGRLLGALPAGALDHTTVFVLSDHGFLPSTREIRPNVRLRRLGALRVEAGKITGEARFVMNHGAGALYRLDGDVGAVTRLARELEKMEGVSGMWPAAQYAALGLPTPEDHRQVADVMFEAAPGYAFGDDAAGDDEHGPPKFAGTHGQRPIYADNAAFFLAAGPDIKRGVRLPTIRSRDVAPTIAASLGIDLGPVEGVTLQQVLN